MEAGYLADQGHGTHALPKWLAGIAEKSIWVGLKLRGKPLLEVSTYRCRRCGYLESYAERPSAG
jgi:hypothetical protein